MLRLEGKTNEALRLFEVNKNTFPNEAQVYLTLGETYLLMGDLPNAKNQFSETLQRDPQQIASIEYLRHLN